MKIKLTEKQKARYERKIFKILAEQKFIVEDRERKIIREQLSNGRRYFFMVAKRFEEKEIVERFVKVPVNNTKTILTPFQRQIEIARFIKTNNILNTRGIIADNYDPKKGTTFVVMETFPADHSKIGFIEKNEGLELLGKHEAEHVVDQLIKFHAISAKSLPTKLRNILKIHPDEYKQLRKSIFKYLNRQVRPLDSGKNPEAFWKVLERRIGIIDLKDKAKKILNDLEPIISSKVNQSNSLIHGDAAPNNLYVFDSGEVELLDLEWVGSSNNNAIAMIYDFGNMRARSWCNEKFRHALDAALVDSYEKNGQEELGRAIVRLSILRSHILLSGAFENYEHEKQKDPLQTRRRKSTEKDISQAFRA